MQTPRKAVRYYIDREADTPIIRTVPVTRPSAVATLATDPRRAAGPNTAVSTESERERRDARQRLTNLVRAGVRKNRRHAS